MSVTTVAEQHKNLFGGNSEKSSDRNYVTQAHTRTMTPYVHAALPPHPPNPKSCSDYVAIHTVAGEWME